jgi:methionyl-tRNA formyltransferase
MPFAAPVPFVPLQVGRPIRVAFFLGSDVTSHIIANRLLPILLRSRATVHIFLTRARPNRRRPRRLQQLHFVEHALLQDHAYPYVDSYGIPAPDQFNTPAGWRALAPTGLIVRDVANVNDPEFVAELAAARLDVAVSVRCYQKFRKPILDLLSRPGSRFVNLHPGLLPHYRGVNTFVRSMIEGAPRAGFSLHDLDVEFDTGDVIGQASFPLSYSRSVVENMIAHATDAASLILDLVQRISAGRPVPARAQDDRKARYFSYPTDADLDRLARNGIDVFRASAVIDVLADAFFGTLADIGGLRDTLIEAVRDAGIPAEDSRDRRLMLSSASR